MAKILVVEDDQTLQRAYVTVLRMEGFEVQSASDGEEALKVTETYEPDLILLDMLMPKVDGVTFLQRYHLKEKHPNTKVIVFSNVSVPYKIEEAEMYGAEAYLIKATFTPKEMVAKVKETLGKQA